MARNDLGHWVPSTSNPGGRPRPPDRRRTRLAQLSPRAVERLSELLDSDDERVKLEAAKAILERHLGRPAIQVDISLHRAAAGGPRSRSRLQFDAALPENTDPPAQPHRLQKVPLPYGGWRIP